MAQGLLKKASKPRTTNSTSSSSSAHNKSTGITKKGARVLLPRKQALQRQAKLNKKLTAGLTAETEKMLGEKAGYLEMIGKGRKNKGRNGTDGGTKSNNNNAATTTTNNTKAGESKGRKR